MKKLSIFVFSILFLSCICYSQDTTKIIQPDFDKAGFYLQKASTNLKVSVISGFAAAGLAFWGSSNFINNKESNSHPIYIVASVLGVISITCTISSIFNIGKAGNYLRGGNKNKLVLKTSKDGIGLAFKF
jgi:hypothetical protein